MSELAQDPSRSWVAMQVERFFWCHPEWYWFLGSATGWYALLAHAGAHHGHLQHRLLGFPGELANWCWMVLAMMVPLVMGQARLVAFYSLRRRRHLALLEFMAGYGLCWLAIGAGVAWSRGLPTVHSDGAAAVAFGLAAVWYLSPWRDKAVVACHRSPALAPTGFRADLDCVRSGLVVGQACVLTCAPLMLACAFTGHSLLAMVGGAALCWSERLSFRRPTRAPMLGSFALAAGYVWSSVQ